MNSNEIRLAVAGHLSANGAVFSARYVGQTTRDGWGCYAWRVTLARAGQQFDTDYFMGLAHATKPKTKWDTPKPKPPTAADVISSLLLDSEALNQSFPDWCDDFGYSSDSIKAFDVYRTCCDTGKNLRRVFTRAQLSELSELVQDY